MKLQISSKTSIELGEIEINAVRAQGAGGQNVNKVATAVHLRFDIAASSLPDFYKTRLLNLRDRRISKDGVIVIKAQQFRSQEKNREAAFLRLRDLIRSVAVPTKKRLVSRPGLQTVQKRLDAKKKRARQKNLRKKVGGDQLE